MLRTFAFVLLLSLVPGAIAAAADNAPPTEPADMQVLFNGRDLTGWDGDTKL